jgi:hypothetical protein
VRVDTSSDALVELAKQGVPDAVIRAMILRASSQERAAVKAVPAPQPLSAVPGAAPSTEFKAKRFLGVTVHRTKYAGCPEGELAITTAGIETSRCRGVDFKAKWPEIDSVCCAYGAKGVMVLRTAAASHWISTITPAEMREISETIRRARPQIQVVQSCED